MICIKCNKEIFPFFSTESNNSGSYITQFLASDTIKLYFKGINEFNNNQNLENNEDDFDLTPIINCKYLDINSFKSCKGDKKNFSILQLNIASLSLHKEEFENVLTLLDFKFDVIGISETKLKKGINRNFDISLLGYNHFSIQTE